MRSGIPKIVRLRKPKEIARFLWNSCSLFQLIFKLVVVKIQNKRSDTSSRVIIFR